jgi:acetoin utilization protein AcuC
LVLCPEARTYDFGPQHPLRPERVLLAWDLIRATGLDRLEQVERLACEPADEPTLQLVHSAEYIDAVRRAGHGEEGAWGAFGLGPGDNPIFDRMHEAGALVAGASVAAARAVWSGECLHSFNAAGGLHHAMPSRASGFCVYDDPAIAIAWLLERGAERIAYVDVDVHHGDGPQFIFWDEPRVLTVSLHQFAPWFFPGTGDLSERGGPSARDTAVNVPLPPFTGDEVWLEALRTVAVKAVRDFQPDVLVTQLGCDTHHSDPLAHMRLTTRAYREAARELHSLAHEVTEGRWIATGGGGYQWATVTPRAWTLYFAEMCDIELNDAIPEQWIQETEFLLRGEVPVTFSEPPLPEGEGDDDARAITAIALRMLGG